jgi:hypothetical protein
MLECHAERLLRERPARVDHPVADRRVPSPSGTSSTHLRELRRPDVARRMTGTSCIGAILNRGLMRADIEPERQRQRRRMRMRS